MSRKDRTIEKIRKAYPNATWRYEWPSRWISSEGWYIQAYSKLAHCCYNSCEHSYTVYIRSDTNEEVFGLDAGIFGRRYGS